MISAVANDADATLVLGVNDDAYDPKRHRIISNASSTTNCVTPLAKVLHDAFGIERGFMTTVPRLHGHPAGARCAAQRSAPGAAAAINLIPTTTGVVRGSLEGRSFVAFYRTDQRVLAAVAVNRDTDLRRAIPLIKARRPVEPAKLRDPDLDLRNLL